MHTAHVCVVDPVLSVEQWYLPCCSAMQAAQASEPAVAEAGTGNAGTEGRVSTASVHTRVRRAANCRSDGEPGLDSHARVAAYSTTQARAGHTRPAYLTGDHVPSCINGETALVNRREGFSAKLNPQINDTTNRIAPALAPSRCRTLPYFCLSDIQGLEGICSPSYHCF